MISWGKSHYLEGCFVFILQQVSFSYFAIKFFYFLRRAVNDAWWPTMLDYKIILFLMHNLTI